MVTFQEYQAMRKGPGVFEIFRGKIRVFKKGRDEVGIALGDFNLKISLL